MLQIVIIWKRQAQLSDREGGVAGKIDHRGARVFQIDALPLGAHQAEAEHAAIMLIKHAEYPPVILYKA